MRVKNLNTGPRYQYPSCNCSNWLEHWQQNYAGSVEWFCRSCRSVKPKSGLVGGHVIKVNSSDKEHYIVPICYSCNNKTEHEFYVDIDELVNANAKYCKNNSQ